MDPNIALIALLNAIDTQDVEAYWQALDDLHTASAQTGKLPDMPTLSQGSLEVVYAAAYAQAEHLGELVTEAKDEGNSEAAAEYAKSLEELEAVLQSPMFSLLPKPR